MEFFSSHSYLLGATVLVLREMAAEAREDEQLPGRPLLGAPEFASHLAAHRAAEHADELAEMARVLDAKGVQLPPERFDGSKAELLRYAASCGLLEVRAAFSCAGVGAADIIYQ